MSAGTLYVVATPIGNLDDASPRAIETLRSAALIACEDTRTTRTLLARYGVATRAVSLHEHNERAAAAGLLDELRRGRDIALVSDAGTPAFSDPGALLVSDAHREGVRVSPLPGANAAAAAISVSGFAAAQFMFAGFLPATGAARRKALQVLELPWPVVFYEAPHRVAETLADLAERFGPARELVIARELTKKFEEVVRLPLGGAAAWLAGRAQRSQGEFVLVLGPGEKPSSDEAQGERVLGILLETLSPSDAARLAARITGVARNLLYRKALERAK